MKKGEKIKMIRRKGKKKESKKSYNMQESEWKQWRKEKNILNPRK